MNGRSCILYIFGLLMALSVSAQIRVSLETDRRQYILYEEVLLKINLQNNSGNLLAFGSEPGTGGYVRVEVFDSRNRKLVLPTADEPGRAYAGHEMYLNAGQGLQIPSGASKSVVVPINEFYQLSKTGTYRVQVRVHHPRLQFDYLSSQVQFKLSEGVLKWSRDIGVPGATSRDKISYRRATVSVFQADQTQLFYLMINDNDYVYMVERLAPRVGGVEPQIEVDARSNIHFFTQTQPRVFSHFVYDVDGSEVQRAHYIVEEYLPIPRLIRDPDIGRVMVAGGRRARDGTDFNDVSLPVMEAEEIPGEPTQELQ